MTFIKKSGKIYERRDVPVDASKYEAEIVALNKIKNLTSAEVVRANNYYRTHQANYKTAIESEVIRLQGFIDDINKVR